jgi:AraC-like DNA-binding protein
LKSDGFRQQTRTFQLSDNLEIALNAFRGSFHLSSELDPGRIQLLFIESLGTQISRLQTFRQISEGAILSFGGNRGDAVSDQASRGVAINLSGGAVERIKAMVSATVRERMALREGVLPALATRMTAAGRLLRRRLVRTASLPAMPADAAEREQALLALTAAVIEQALAAPGASEVVSLPQRLHVAGQVSALLTCCPRSRDGEWALDEVGRRLRISPRLIQLAMQEVFGVGFAEYRKLVRLHQLRTSIRQARPGAKVTDIALDHLFSNPGRMAGQYKALFGAAPSDDLAQALQHA